MEPKRNFDVLYIKYVTLQTVVQNQINSLKTKVTSSPKKHTKPYLRMCVCVFYVGMEIRYKVKER